MSAVPPLLGVIEYPPLKAANAGYTGKTTSPLKKGVPPACRTGVCFPHTVGSALPAVRRLSVAGSGENFPSNPHFPLFPALFSLSGLILDYNTIFSFWQGKNQKKFFAQGLSRMDNVAPIQIAAFQRMNQGFRRGNVSRYRDIVYVTQAQKLRRIALRLFLRQRIPEK